MNKKSLYMIGIIHMDKGAQKRLRKIIESIGPCAITVEFTNYGLNFRRKNYRRIRRKLKRKLSQFHELPRTKVTENLLNFLRIPYEYVIAKNYARNKGIPLYLVDMDFFSFLRLRYVDDLLKDENVRIMAKCACSHDLNDEKRIADMYFEKNTKLFKYSEEMRVRDEYTCRLIRRIMEENRGEKIVHVCGWQHLADEYGYFSKLNPHKIYIYDKALRF